MKRATIVFVRHGQTDQNVAMQAGAAVQPRNPIDYEKYQRSKHEES